jgi:asparagine synthase (glutamine-hydrolysing)
MHYMIWASYEAAEQAGVRVMLNGFDGDTTVSHGVLRLRELVQRGKWTAFAHEVRALVERHSDLDHHQPFEELLGSANALYNTFARPQLQTLAETKQWARFARAAYALNQHLGVSPWALARQHGRALVLPQAVRDAASSIQGSMLMRNGGPSPADKGGASPAETTKKPGGAEEAPFGLALLREEVVRRWAVEDRIREARKAGPAPNDQAAPSGRPTASDRSAASDPSAGNKSTAANETVRTRQRARFAMPSLAEGLEAMNHYGAHFGVAPRMPFMDVRLIRYCLALPSDQSLKDGWTRVVFRRAMSGILPERIRMRVGKARMWAANKQGLLEANADPLRRHVHDLGPLEAFVDKDELLRLYMGRDDLKPHDFILLQRTAALAAWTKLRFRDYDAFETSSADGIQ